MNGRVANDPVTVVTKHAPVTKYKFPFANHLKLTLTIICACVVWKEMTYPVLISFNFIKINSIYMTVGGMRGSPSLKVLKSRMRAGTCVCI